MPRRVFYSFHYDLDNWRVQTVKNIHAIEAQPKLPANEWEKVWRQGSAEIQRWIDRQMKGKSCVIVLIGTQTAERRWVQYEIRKGWDDGKGVLGIHIHKLLDQYKKPAKKGRNPFFDVTLPDGKKLSQHAIAYDPLGSSSKAVYEYIEQHIEGWVEAAVSRRGR